MKYQIGDHVKYDSGDWWFFGTITAVIDNAINPCYRLMVDSMVKKNCRFSITPYEFELHPDEKMATAIDIFHPQEPSPTLLTPEPATSPKPYAKQSPIKPTKKPTVKRTPTPKSKPKSQPEEQQPKSQPEERRPEEQFFPDEPKADMIEISPIPKTIKPKIQRTPTPKPTPTPKRQAGNLQSSDPISENPKTDTIDVLQSSPSPVKRRTLVSWDTNFDLYVNGVRTNAVNKWIFQNRKNFKSNSLSEEKLNKLIEINFPFEPGQQPINPKEHKNQTKSYQRNSWWNYKIKQWKSGKYEALKSWRQKCVRLYVTGKLPQERITQLKEIGLL